MKCAELAWLAGVVEGEGYIGRNRNHGVIRVVMTDADIIQRLNALSGIGTVNEQRPRTPACRRPYAWTVERRSNVAALAYAISPLLGRRRREGISTILGLHDHDLPPSRALLPGSDEAWAWTSGLIEGEGYIQPGPLMKDKRVRVSVESTDKDVAERLAVLTGVGEVRDSRLRTRRKPIWRWYVGNKPDAEYVLGHILPHLGHRRAERAHYALSRKRRAEGTIPMPRGTSSLAGRPGP